MALLPLSPAPVSAAQPEEEPRAGLAARAAEASSVGRTEYAYGPDDLQQLDFWPAATGKPAPLILFVHGGGWKHGDKRTATGMQKVEHLTGEGFAFASINYRLVPTATVEQQAADVATAVAWLRAHAARLGVDASRIVLMGHSAGAHLVALVGTDPRYLAAAGLSLSDVRGVIALDGAAYDIPRQVAAAGRLMRGTYREAFGDEPARQRALSPALQTFKARTPAFLIVHIDRADGKAQSEALGEALLRAGTSAEVHGVDGTGLLGHLEINRALGRADHPATAVVDAWLRKLLHTT
ncbi:alpha/beta hydrolase [Variovorax sp. GT1P44]|uniref:alpha/beta hydrolase n=1 Tax=Variovorax sp. GT1P44 TaxID=3443742 RepID=UPI003F482DFA